MKSIKHLGINTLELEMPSTYIQCANILQNLNFLFHKHMDINISKKYKAQRLLKILHYKPPNKDNLL